MTDTAPNSEFLINTQPHTRNKTFKIIIRDLEKNVIVNTFGGDQLMRPQLIQILQNGHMIIGYSTVRPFHYDFISDEGVLYNRIESDSDKCTVLHNGLLVERFGKQTFIKQVMPEFKMPRIIQIYDEPFQWIDLWGDKLLAYHNDLLYVLDLSEREPKLVLPLSPNALQLDGNVLYSVMHRNNFVQRIHLENLLQNGFTRTETCPIAITRQKINSIKLYTLNNHFTIYQNRQKQNAREVGTTSHFLVDWTKRETIWSSKQDLVLVATSPDGYVVFFDQDSDLFSFLVCGSSLMIPIPLLTGQKPKGESKFLSNGMFVFHGERKIIVLDLETSTVHAQYDVTRHPCDLMTLSKCNYKPKPRPEEIGIDVSASTQYDVKQVEFKQEVAEIQKMVERQETIKVVASQIPPPPPPPPEWIPPPPPPLPLVEEITKPLVVETLKVEEIKKEDVLKVEPMPVDPPKPMVESTKPPVDTSSSGCTIM